METILLSRFGLALGTRLRKEHRQMIDEGSMSETDEGSAHAAPHGILLFGRCFHFLRAQFQGRPVRAGPPSRRRSTRPATAGPSCSTRTATTRTRGGTSPSSSSSSTAAAAPGTSPCPTASASSTRPAPRRPRRPPRSRRLPRSDVRRAATPRASAVLWSTRGSTFEASPYLRDDCFTIKCVVGAVKGPGPPPLPPLAARFRPTSGGRRPFGGHRVRRRLKKPCCSAASAPLCYEGVASAR